ncbi:MAG: GNAT family N-acetyltransferase [Spirochaetales bacterium]|nr:GNAT family N-acetyltransferase [Spirochaetales bacterium]
MKIEKASKSDLGDIVSLKIQMFKDAELLHLLADNSQDTIQRTYIELYKEKMVQHFIYRSEGKIVAMAGGFIKDDFPYCFYKNGRYGFVGDMFTQADFRRQGLAQQLLSRTLLWFRESNISHVQLLSSKDGKELYRKNGFIEKMDLMSLELV